MNTQYVVRFEERGGKRSNAKFYQTHSERASLEEAQRFAHNLKMAGRTEDGYEVRRVEVWQETQIA